MVTALQPSGVPIRARLCLQVLGELSRGDGAFADCGGDAFDGAVADIAGGEDAGQTGLQRTARAEGRGRAVLLSTGTVARPLPVAPPTAPRASFDLPRLSMFKHRLWG